ncbi:MAG: restriction endonuclease subunit S, partial [Firmicutes bacterium]|nr:restriction endonuclease subunit S [Bacillota bacterium]
MKLHEMAEIRTGLVVARKKAESGAGNQYKALTLKSFEEDGWVNVRELEAFESVEELSSQYLTQKRDVIVRLSYPHTAVCINENLEGVLIPSLFTVIRLHDQSLLPEFLALYLNSDKIKRRVAQAAVGSAISVIKTGFLKDL